MLSDAAPPDHRASPFVGLSAFSEKDSEFFFGRDLEIGRVVSNLRGSRLTLLYGSSGVGKSSILNAGAVCRLRELARANQREYGSAEFAVVVFRAWQVEPFQGLKDEVLHSTGMEIDEAESLPLIDVLRRCAERVGGELFVVLDQFEEFFRYNDGKHAKRFIKELAEAINTPDLRVNFLLSIREDALAKLDRFKRYVPNLFRNVLRVQPLDRQAAEAAIKRPIAKYGDTTQTHVDIEPQLVSQILDEIGLGEDPSAASIEGQSIAPLLQLVMTRLWEEERRAGSTTLRLRTLKERVGGAQGIVERHVEERIGSLSERECELAASLFDRLVTPSGEKIAHTAADLEQWADASEAEIHSVLDKLANSENRILRPAAQNRYEIYHDVLGRPILAWLTHYVGDRKLHAERKRFRKRLRNLAFVAVILLVALGATITFAIIAERARQNAEMGRTTALALLEIDGTETGVTRSGLLAVESLGIRPSLSADKLLRDALRLRIPADAYLRHGSAVSGLAFSPDGTLLATTSGNAVRVWDIEAREPTAQFQHAGADLISFSPAGTHIAVEGRRVVAVWNLASGEQVATIEHGGTVRDFAFSPDGTRIATASDDNTACVLELVSGSELVRLEHGEWVLAIEFSPDGSRIATACIDGSARLWSSTSFEMIREFIHGSLVTDITYSPDGTRVVSAGGDDCVRIWDIDTATQLGELWHEGDVNGVVYSPDGRLIASYDASNTAHIWDAHSGERRAQLAHSDTIRSIEFSPASSQIVTACSDGAGHVWDTTGTELARLAHDGNVYAAAFSPNGTVIASAGLDGFARIWDTTVPPEPVRIAHSSEPAVAAFSNDGQHVITMDEDGVVSQWNAFSGVREQIFSSLAGEGSCATISGDGTRVARHGHSSNIVSILDLGTGNALPLLEYGDEVESLAMNSDGSRVACAGMSSEVEIWDVDTGSLLLAKAHSEDVSCLAFDPDGHSLAVAGWSGSVHVWDVATGEVHSELAHAEQVLKTIAFSPDGKIIAGVDGLVGKSAYLWDAEDGSLLAQLAHEDTMSTAVFSPSGDSIVTTSADGTAKLWNATNGREIASLPHGSGVNDAAFNSDGTRLVTSDSSDVVWIWDTETGEPLTQLPHESGVMTVAFSSDGRRLVTQGYDDNIVRVWRVDYADLITEACQRMPRNFTQEEWDRFFPGQPYSCTCANLPVGPGAEL